MAEIHRQKQILLNEFLIYCVVWLMFVISTWCWTEMHNKHSENKITFFMFKSYLPEIQKFRKHITSTKHCMSTVYIILKAHAINLPNF